MAIPAPDATVWLQQACPLHENPWGHEQLRTELAKAERRGPGKERSLVGGKREEGALGRSPEQLPKCSVVNK